MPSAETGEGDEDLNRLQRIHEQVVVLLVVRHWKGDKGIREGVKGVRWREEERRG